MPNHRAQTNIANIDIQPCSNHPKYFDIISDERKLELLVYILGFSGGTTEIGFVGVYIFGLSGEVQPKLEALMCIFGFAGGVQPKLELLVCIFLGSLAGGI